MSYTFATLWHERRRFIPAVLAVAFSALLVALQSGLLLGTLSVVSLPIDRSSADLWVAAPDVASVDAGVPISIDWAARLNSADVARSEPYILGLGYWKKPGRGSEKCLVVGTRLTDDSLGAVRDLTPELRMKLSEPGAVVVDEADRGRLGLKNGVGDVAEIRGQRVRVVGLVRGYRGLAAPYVFCSVDTARRVLRMARDQATYLVARCRDPREADAVAARLRRYDDMSVFTGVQFSRRSRVHWLARTGAGVALGLATALGLLVGAVVTSQTLFAATVASLREFAVLRAMGVARWRMAAVVLSQSFWVGVAGVLIAIPAVTGLGRLAELLGAEVLLRPWLMNATGGVTLTMAVASGLAALRSLRLVEPAALLR